MRILGMQKGVQSLSQVSARSWVSILRSEPPGTLFPLEPSFVEVGEQVGVGPVKRGGWRAVPWYSQVRAEQPFLRQRWPLCTDLGGCRGGSDTPWGGVEEISGWWGN